MKNIIMDCRRLAVFDPHGEVYTVWHSSLVDELVDAGYSAPRAEQVIDNLTALARREA